MFLRKVSPIFFKVLHFIIECGRWTVILLAVVLIVLHLSGIRPYIVITGSMSPTIPVGSICMVNHNIPYCDIIAGDIISFKVGESMQVMHRAVRVDSDGIITQGDANNVEDTSKVTEENYLGKTILSIPKLGIIVTFLKSRYGILITGILFVLCLFSILKSDTQE